MGKGLADTANTDDNSRERVGGTCKSIENQETIQDAQLLKLAKGFLCARLDHSLEQIELTKQLLIDYLDAEHERMKRHCRKSARQIMIMKIRCALVKHPYDHIGRQMASVTKTLFQMHVLRETKFWHKLDKFFKIPLKIRTAKWVQKTLIIAPFLIAIFVTIQKGIVYCSDMYSDIQVISELEKNLQDFKIPELYDF